MGYYFVDSDVDSSPTDAPLREDPVWDVEVICINSTELRIDPNLYLPPFDFYVPAKEVPSYPEWEGIFHAKLKHDRQTMKAQHRPLPMLFRRMEKRPYSGHCNLRF